MWQGAGPASGRTGARQGRAGRPAGSSCAHLGVPAGPIGCSCTRLGFSTRFFDSVFFLSHLMNTVHCKTNFEKKIYLLNSNKMK